MVCVNYKALNKVIKKDSKHKNDLIHTLCHFLKSFWKGAKARNAHIWRWVQGLSSNENCSKGSFEDHIHHTMGNILLHNNALWFV
jgi:hypothetical protein